MNGSANSLLRVDRLVKHYRMAGAAFRPAMVLQAVAGVSFALEPGEALGLVGESGCGKSTTGRCLIGLEQPTSGSVFFNGEDVVGAGQLQRVRRDMQFVFQDPYGSLNPLMTVFATLSEPLRLSGMSAGESQDRVHDLLETVGLSPEHGNRFPHEFSGGQRQRIGIARALALRPRLLILDEPVSALDVSIQAQIVNLLQDLQEQFGLAYLFIAHDLAVVSQIADRVAVMYLGRIVEIGIRKSIFEHPAHPYTQALLSAVPVTDPDQRGLSRRIVLGADIPSAADPPSGCRFRTRCWKAQSVCAEIEPELELSPESGTYVACHFPS
jgi:oligopeptide/dipeptide ABC transporter ATP-binding protein